MADDQSTGNPAPSAVHPLDISPPSTHNQIQPTNYPGLTVSLRRRLAHFWETVESFFCILAIVGFVGFIIWQIWLPLIPYPQFHLDKLSVSNFTISPGSISGAWDARFIVRNPNSKINVHCDHIQVAVVYSISETSVFCSISETSVLPFTLGAKNKTAITAAFSFSEADGYYEEAGGQIMNFNVWMKVRVKPSAWGARRRMLRVFCPDLPIMLSSGTLSLAAPKKCWVDNDLWFVNIRPPPVQACTSTIGLY